MLTTALFGLRHLPPVGRNLSAVCPSPAVASSWDCGKSRVTTPRNSLPALGWRLTEPGSSPRLLLSGADHGGLFKGVGILAEDGLVLE